LHEAGLFRLLLPRSSNGIETDPVTFFRVMEVIAQADAGRLGQVGGITPRAPPRSSRTIRWSAASATCTP
jgi:hypothetical protein